MNFDKFKTKQTIQNENITLKCEGKTITITSTELNSIFTQHTILWDYFQQPQIQERLKKHQNCIINFLPYERLEILIEYIRHRINATIPKLSSQKERENIVKQLRICKVSLTESLMYCDLSNESLTSEMWIRNCFFGDEDIGRVVIKHDINRKLNASFDMILRNCGIDLIINEWRSSAELLSQHYCGMSLDESLNQMKVFYITQLKLGEIEVFACELIYTLDKKKEYRNEIEIVIGKYLIQKDSMENSPMNILYENSAIQINKEIVKLIEYYSIDILLAKCKALVYLMDISVDPELFLLMFSDLKKQQIKYTKLDVTNYDITSIKSLRINNQSLGNYQSIQYQNLQTQLNQQNSNSQTNQNSQISQNQFKEKNEEKEIIIMFIDHYMNVFGISMKVGSKMDNWMSPISLFSLQNTNKEPYTFLKSLKELKVQRINDGAFWNYVIEDCFMMRLIRPFSVAVGEIHNHFDKKVKLDGNLFMGVSVGMIKDIFILE